MTAGPDTGRGGAATAAREVALRPPGQPLEELPISEEEGNARRGARWVRERWWFLTLLFVSGVLIVPPLALMVWTSLTPGGGLGISSEMSLDGYRDVLTSEGFRDILADTAVFTLGASIGSIFLGCAMAWFVARTDMVGKTLIYLCVFLSFAIPGMIEAIGWILLFGEGAGIINGFLDRGLGFTLTIQSMSGMIFVQTLSWAPMVFLLLVGPFKAIDASIEDSARVSGARKSYVYRRITAPLLAPSILAVLILVIIRAVQAFEVPLFLGTPAGVKTFTTEIYGKLRRSYIPDYAEAAAYGTILVLLLLATLMYYHHVTRTASRYTTVTGKAFKASTIPLGRGRWVMGGIAAILFLLYVAPALAMAVTSVWPNVGAASGLGDFTFRNYEELAGHRSLWPGIRNSLVIGVVTATIATLLCLAAAFLVVRSAIPGRQSLDHILSIPIVIPGTVLGLAFLITYLRVPIAVYGTIWIFVLAYIAHYAPYAMRYLQPSLLQISKDIDDAGRISGGKGHVVLRRILLPLVVPAVIGSWLYVFFHAFRDISIAAMIYTAQTPVVATQLLDMWQDGVAGVLSAYGSLLSIVSILIGGGAFYFAKRMGFKE
ncbi:MAG: iron ABC transporter permease [Mycobacteriales bacterium]